MSAGRRRVDPPSEIPPLAAYAITDATMAHLAMHNAHRLGQIVTPRQILGAWPPPEGSWTWQGARGSTRTAPARRADFDGPAFSVSRATRSPRRLIGAIQSACSEIISNHNFLWPRPKGNPSGPRYYCGSSKPTFRPFPGARSPRIIKISARGSGEAEGGEACLPPLLHHGPRRLDDYNPRRPAVRRAVA